MKLVKYILILFLFSCANESSKTGRGPKSLSKETSGYRMIVSKKGVKCAGEGQVLNKGERFKDDVYYEKFGECLNAIPYRLILKGIFVGNNRIQCGKELRFYKENPKYNDSFYEEGEFLDFDSCEKIVSSKNDQLRENLVKKYIEKNPKYSEFEDWAKRGLLRTGMPEELVYLGWGEPSKTHTTKGKLGIHKKLEYRSNNSTKYAYIQNGFLTSLQD